MSPSELPHGWTVGEFGRYLIAPDAGERLAPIRALEGEGTRGPGVIVLDLPASDATEIARFGERLLEELPILPCVTIALGTDSIDPSELALREVCDVVVASPDEIAPLLAGFSETPVSALAFVQLLRSASDRSIYAGLVAESFVYSTLQSGVEFRQWLEGRRKRKGGGWVDESAVCRMERDRGRLDIRLTRPRKHNAFSRAMRDGLSEALQLALADPSIERVVLSGEGDSFCSGGDLDEFGSFPDPAEAHAIRTTRSPALLLSRLGERVRVEVQGACIGAGAELPAFTPRVVASEDAFFQLPEVGLGLVPGAGGTASLPRRIGRQRTAWLGLSGARLAARAALAWGLVDEVRLGQHVEPDRVDSNRAE
ncbi:MAG: enoyl-CoA hydratase/isomerase family protein [bacterium]|nr:hypothetical protein [Deltaproteobacteria bacterium]MCP4904729.1 enoyl-CoA hydratase/isomerase family protein [bacterium]